MKQCFKCIVGGALLGVSSVLIFLGIPGCIQSMADVQVVQAIENEDYSITLRRINYHATVSYGYDVKACSKITKRCGVYFKGLRFGENPPSIYRLDENRIVIHARSGHILDFSNEFDYDFEPLRGITFILQTNDILPKSTP